MNTPTITMLTAAACATLQFTLTALIIARRVKSGVRFLDGGNESLLYGIRAHGNLIENAPIILILMLLLELTQGASPLLWLAAGMLVVGRAIHALSLVTTRAPWGRQVGMLATLFVMSGLALANVVVAFRSIF